MKQPSATVERQYGHSILKAQYFTEYDERGHVDETKSYAILSLHDLGETKYPLLWSRTVTRKQATTAIEFYEATGITLQ